MFRIISFTSLMLVLLSSGCLDKPDLNDGTVEDIVFTTTESVQLNIPSAIGLNIPFNIPGITVSTQFNEEIDNVNPLIDLVENISLKGMKLTLMTPASEDFGFLKHITVYMKAPGQPEIELAHLFNVPASAGKEIVLEPIGHQLDNYVREPFELRTEVVIDELFLQEATVQADMDLEVTLINY